MADVEESRTQHLPPDQEVFAHLGPLIYEKHAYLNWLDQGGETRCITQRPAEQCACGHFQLIWETADVR